LEIAHQISDVMDNFLKGQEKDAGIFDLIKEIFLILDEKTAKNQRLIYLYFLWNFLGLQGYKSKADICAVCSEKLNPYEVYFSNIEGGVICKKCLMLDPKAQKINSDVVKILRLILKKEWQILSKLKVEKKSVDESAQISENYYLYVLPK
jgi:DNA repair protein RecO (recombination protein O)